MPKKQHNIWYIDTNINIYIYNIYIYLYMCGPLSCADRLTQKKRGDLDVRPTEPHADVHARVEGCWLFADGKSAQRWFGVRGDRWVLSDVGYGGL